MIRAYRPLAGFKGLRLKGGEERVIGNFCFWVPFLKQLLLRNCVVDFVEICNVYIGKMIIKAAKRIFNFDKICRSYSDLNCGVTFFGTQCSALVLWAAGHIFPIKCCLPSLRRASCHQTSVGISGASIAPNSHGATLPLPLPPLPLFSPSFPSLLSLFLAHPLPFLPICPSLLLSFPIFPYSPFGSIPTCSLTEQESDLTARDRKK